MSKGEEVMGGRGMSLTGFVHSSIHAWDVNQRASERALRRTTTESEPKRAFACFFFSFFFFARTNKQTQLALYRRAFCIRTCTFNNDDTNSTKPRILTLSNLTSIHFNSFQSIPIQFNSIKLSSISTQYTTLTQSLLRTARSLANSLKQAAYTNIACPSEESGLFYTFIALPYSITNMRFYLSKIT